jgi:hypothetical protein
MKTHSARQWRIVLRLYDMLMVFLVLLMLVIVAKWYFETGEVRAPVSVASLFWFVVWLLLRGVAKKKKEEAEAAEAKASLPISSE